MASRTDRELQGLLRGVDDRSFVEAVKTCRVTAALLGVLCGRAAELAGVTRLIFSVLDGLALNHTLGGRAQVAQRTLATLLQRCGRCVADALGLRGSWDPRVDLHATWSAHSLPTARRGSRMKYDGAMDERQ